MASKKMEAHAKGWKSPAERREDKRENLASTKEAGKIAGKAPPNTTRMKGKNSPDSKGPSVNAWTKGNKLPKGC